MKEKTITNITTSTITQPNYVQLFGSTSGASTVRKQKLYFLALLLAASFVNSLLAWNDSLVSNMKEVRRPGGRLDWHPGIEKIAYDEPSFPDRYNDLWLMDPDGSDRVCLTCDREDIPQLYIGQPVWHPSGRWIVFQMEKDSAYDTADAHLYPGTYSANPGGGLNNDLWVVDLNDTSFHRLTKYPTKRYLLDPQPFTGVLHPHFSHDGDYLLYGYMYSGGGVEFGLWRMILAEFDTSGPPYITKVDSFCDDEYGVTWFETHGFSPDDSEIICTANPRSNQPPHHADICVIELATRELINLTSEYDSVWDEHAHFSPNGKKIVWMTNLNEGWGDTSESRPEAEWWIMDADGGAKKRLTYFNRASHPESVAPLFGIASDICWPFDDTLIGWCQEYSTDLSEGHSVIHKITLTERSNIVTCPTNPVFDNLKVYPNPFSRSCRIDGPLSVEYEIYDLRGNKIFTSRESEFTWVPRDKSNGGVYILKTVQQDNDEAPSSERLIYLK